MSYGFASFIGIGRETTWGTGVAATAYLEAMSEGLQTQIERFEYRNMVGRFTEADDAAGVVRHQGDIVVAAHAGNMGHLLMGYFGLNSVTVGVSGSFFTNIFTPIQSDVSSLNPLPPYTFEVYRAGTLVNSSFRYSGVQVNQLQFNIQPNQDLRITANVIAKDQTFIAKSTPTFPGSPVEAFFFDTCSISFGGAASARFENVTITLNNNLIGIPTLNASNQIAKVRRDGPPMVGFTATVDFTDLDEFLRFKTQTEMAFSAYFTKASSFSLFIEIPRLVLTDVPVRVPGKNRLTLDMTGKGRYHTGSGCAVKFSLTATTTYS